MLQAAADLSTMGPAASTHLLDERRPKLFRRGTHRVMSPSETLARVRPHAAAMGITRLGNITGLDRIGIPVAVAVRPNSRSVSVSQGKGLDLPQAMASALMEASEGFHAEEIGPCRRATYGELSADADVVEPSLLCADERPFDPGRSIAWKQGYDLLRCGPCWVPAEIVHTDYTLPERDGYFLAGSNGLASGNHLVEAVIAALCELIERDAVALWAARPIAERAAAHLDLASIDDPDCNALVDKFAAARIALRIWNVTTDIGVAVFLCDIRDAAPTDPATRRRFRGSGCHADRRIALVRALTEAAQTRLTYIAGMRDDLFPGDYADPAGAEVGDALLDALARETAPVSFRDVPSFAADDLADDLRRLLDRLAASGMTRAIAVDLTRPELAIPVVRVIVPGLEWDPHHPRYRPGRRARLATCQ